MVSRFSMLWRDSVWLDPIRRLRIRWRRRTPRGQMASTSGVQQGRVGEITFEVYRLRIRGYAGVGASVYAGGEEVLRFDCLGDFGHWHMNPRQTVWSAAGRVTRIAFLADHVAGQAQESVLCLRRNLRNALAGNWRRRTREIAVADAEIGRLAARVEEAFSRLPPVDESDHAGGSGLQDRTHEPLGARVPGR